MTDFEPSAHHHWDGEDRRQYQVSPPVAQKLGSEPVTREYLDHALAEWKAASREYFNGHFHRLEKKIEDGFPDGDPTAHRAVHEGYIKRAKDRNDLWQAVLKQVVTGTVWAGVLAISAALWIAFKAEVHK
jgi:hypothetical protein